jgi:hypothetical protein
MKGTKWIVRCLVVAVAGMQVAWSQGIAFDTSDVKTIFADGKYITTHFDTLTTTLNIGAPGSSAWEFEGLNETSVMIVKSMPVGSTTWAGDFPQATQALRDTAFTYSFYYDALATTVTLKGTGFVYYALNGNLLNMGLKGAGNAYLLGTGYPAQGQWLNSPPAVEYVLPLQFGTTWSSSYTESISGTATLGAFTLPFGPLQTQHSITYMVDAYGLLTLPGGGIQQALRIRKVDRSVSGANSGVRVGFIFLSKNGAMVQCTANDTASNSGNVGVSSVQWRAGDPNIPVPIQLASFTATRMKDQSITLKWTTLSETNNYGFAILRKGHDESEYTELPGSFVAGHGTTILVHDYAFVDQQATSGAWWYRLKQVDLDGAVHLSEPAQVNLVTGVQETIPTSFGLEQNYPNPFNPTTKIGFGVSGLGARVVRLSVFDILGREVAVLVNESKSAGTYEVKWDASSFPSGVYIYRLVAGSDIESRRMILMK